MNIIYTYKILDHFKPIDSIFFKMCDISVRSANKFYKTILYCDYKSKLLFEHNKIPFSEIIVLESLEKYNGFIYSIPKILTFINQSSPYIHIDLDTVIFNKIQFNSDILFGHADLFFDSNEDALKNEYIINSYINPLNNIFKKNISDSDFTKIPNFSFFAVNNYKLVSFIFNKILIEYQHISNLTIDEFKLYYGNNTGGVPSVFEQFLFYDSLKEYTNNFNYLSIKPCIAMYHDIYTYFGIEYDYNKFLDNIQHYKFTHLQNYRELLLNQTFIQNINKIIHN